MSTTKSATLGYLLPMALLFCAGLGLAKILPRTLEMPVSERPLKTIPAPVVNKTATPATEEPPPEPTGVTYREAVNITRKRAQLVKGLLGPLAQAWGRTNGTEALDFARTLPSSEQKEFVENVLKGWASTDFPSAWSYLLKPESGMSVPDVVRLANELVASSVFSASPELMTKLDGQAIHGQLMQLRSKALKLGVDQAYTTALARPDSEPLLDLFIFSTAVSSQTPERAIELADSLLSPSLSDEKRRHLLQVLLTNVAPGTQLNGVAAWMSSTPGAPKDPASYATLAISASRHSLADAANYSQMIADDSQRNATVSSLLIASTSPTDATTAAAMFDSLTWPPGDSRRIVIARAVASKWGKSDAAALQTFLQTSKTLDSYTRSQLGQP